MMRLSFLILAILAFQSFGQKAEEKLWATYIYSDARFYNRLDLSTDSTFVYVHNGAHCCQATSEGNWRIVSDTLKLFNYKLPWTILRVEEQKNTTISGEIVVKVVTPNQLNYAHGKAQILIDGQPKVVFFESNTKEITVPDFDVWINNNCATKAMTNKLGIVEFKKRSATKISIDYNDYKIKDSSCNSFVITLSSFPLFVQPMTLSWENWKINGEAINPIECSEILDYLTLTKIIKTK